MTDHQETLTVNPSQPYKDRLDKAMANYRGRALHVIEEYCEPVFGPDELATLKRRIRAITGDAWDEMRQIVVDLEQCPPRDDEVTDIHKRLATLENHVLHGGCGTLKHRVDMVEQQGSRSE